MATSQVLPSYVFDRLLNPTEYPTAQSWDRHYFVGGRNMQGAEANEIETLLMNISASLGRTLFSEGSIITGCSVAAQSVPANVVVDETDVENAATIIVGHPVTIATIDEWNQYYRYAAFTKGYLTSLSDNRLDYVYTDPATGSTDVTLDQYFIDRSTQNISIASEVNVTVTSGVMFVVGRVRNVPGTTTPVQLTGFGAETVGIKVTEEVLAPDASVPFTGTTVIDSSLLDPALAPTVGAQQYNLKGALRRVLNFTWSANDPSAITVFEFTNGVLTNTLSQNSSTILQILARQTYDRDGNFSVTGLSTSVRVNQVDASKLDVTVDSGKAYVQGFEINKATPTRLTIDKAIDTAAIVGEQQTFHTATKVYQLSTPIVASVSSLVAQIARTGVPVSKGSTGSFDNVVTQNITQLPGIQALYSVSNIPGYTQGVDYVVSGNSIHWIGSQPTTGSTYYVDLIYLKLMVPGLKKLDTVTNEAVVRGGVPNTSDNLAHTDLLVVLSVANGTDPTAPGYVLYNIGKDYTYTNGRTATTIGTPTIVWLAGGIQPAGAATYYVTYKHWEDVSPNQPDYFSVTSYVDETYTDPNQEHFQAAAGLRYYDDLSSGGLSLGDSLDFRVSGSPDIPVDSTNMSVDYTYYLKRFDSLGLGSNGQFIYYRGVPSLSPAFPLIPTSVLPISYLAIPAFSTFVSVVNPNTRRFTVSDLWDIKIQQDESIYTQALNSAETRALVEQTTSPIKAILADPLIDFSRSQPLIPGELYSIWPEFGLCGLSQQPGSRKLVINPNASMGIKVHKNLVTLAYSEVLGYGQNLASETVIPNPLGTFPPLTLISMDPNQDFFFDIYYLNLNPSQRVDEVIPNDFSFINDTSSQNQQEILANLNAYNAFARVRNCFSRWWTGSGGLQPWGGSLEIASKVPGFQQGALGVGINPLLLPGAFNYEKFDRTVIVPCEALDRVDTKVIDRSIVPYTRIFDQAGDVIHYTIKGVCWPPNVDNIAITMDGVPVAVTPSIGFSAGTDPNTLKADANGNWQGTFPNPGAILTGRRVVLAQAEFGTGVIQAGTIFAAEGLRKTDYTTFKVCGNMDTVQYTWGADPVGQILTPKKSSLVTSIGLYFTSVPTGTNASVTGTNGSPFNITAGVNDTLKIAVDGGASQTITLTPGTNRTVLDVVIDINNQIMGATATISGASVKIAALSEGLGSTLAIQTVANSAYTLLGLTVGTVTGSSYVPAFALQVRDVDANGNPTRNVLATAVVPASSVSTLGETRITFDDPVYMEAGKSYAVCLMTDNPKYVLRVGRIGNLDSVSGVQIAVNTNFGPMVTSPNGLSFNQDPQAFLKMNVYIANFNENNLSTFQGTVYFVPLTDLKGNNQDNNGLPNYYSYFNLAVGQLLPPGSAISWQYSIDGGQNWFPFPVATDWLFGEESTQIIPTNAQFRAVMSISFVGVSSDVSGVTPMFDQNLLGLCMRANAPSATYRTNNISFAPSPISANLRVKFLVGGNYDQYVSLVVTYSTDDGVTWNAMPSPTITQVDLNTPFGNTQWEFNTSFVGKQVQIRIYIQEDPNDFTKDLYFQDLKVIVY